MRKGCLVWHLLNPPLSIIPQEVFDLENPAHIEQDEKFWEFEPLRSLDMSFNRIESLPGDVGNLSDLAVLKLRNNMISYIPEELFQCTNLRHIDLDSNHLGSLSESVHAFQGSLKELILSNNRLEALPTALTQCCALIYLNLSHNCIRRLPSEPLTVQWNLPGMSCHVYTY